MNGRDLTENQQLSKEARRVTGQGLPSSFNFVVHTAFGIPGKSEDTTSWVSRPCRRTRNVLRAPRPHTVKIWGLSEFGSRLSTRESRTGSKDAISSTSVRFSSSRGLNRALGSGRKGSAIPLPGCDDDENSISSSSSPSFVNW